MTKDRRFPIEMNSSSFTNTSLANSSWVSTASPTASPTLLPPPSFAPTATPSFAPTATPSFAPTATPTFAPTATPTFAPSFVPKSICCCSTLGVGGACFDGSKNRIATCTSMKNATVAECFEGENTNGTDNNMECYISECPNAELARSYALVPQIYCFVIGALLVLVAIAMMPMSKKNDREESPEELVKKKKTKMTNDSNTSFTMRTLIILGAEIIVLGGISGNYRSTLGFSGICFLVLFIYIVWKTCKMVYQRNCDRCVPNLYGTTKEFSIIDSTRKDENDAVSLVVSPSDVYDDITTPITRVILLFLCQIILLILYITAIYTAGSADLTKKESYIYFITGVFVQIAYQEAKDRNPVRIYRKKKKYWRKVMNARKPRIDEEGKEGKTIIECADAEGQHKIVSAWSLVARIIMSNLVNWQGTFMLMYLLPLHLSHSEDAIDFVLNSCAAYVIVELDDVINSENIELIPASPALTALTECNTPSSESP